MKMSISTLTLLFGLCTVLLGQASKTELFIEPLGEAEAYDIKGGEGCSPGDIIITIKSDISGLHFDSNVMDIASVNYDSTKGEYTFCHSKESFWLTVSSDRHISKKVYVDGLNNKYAFRIVEKSPTGKIYLKTRPNNALIDFGFSGQSPQLSAYPIEMTSGEYKIRISKNGYKTVDTTIIIPSDGSTSQMEVALTPLFGKIYVDITPEDKSKFQILPVVDIDTAHINLADLQIKEKLHSFDDADNVQYFKLYEGGYIPLPVGSYPVTVNSPGFNTYRTQIISIGGATNPLTVKMKPIVGFLTIIDGGNSDNAEVFVNDQSIGNVPMFKHPVRIGNQVIKLKKAGFMTEKEEYTATIAQDSEYDLPIKMLAYREFQIKSNPSEAEVFVNGTRQGFTPLKISLTEGEHDLILRKHGMLDFHQKISVDDKSKSGIDTIKCKMESTRDLKIISEKDSMEIVIKKGNDVLYKERQVPYNALLSTGKYKIELYDEKGNRFHGNIDFNTQKKVVLPCYSRGTFTALVGDYYLSRPIANSTDENYYNLLASTNFGRFNLAPGLFTSIMKASVFKLEEEFSGHKVQYGGGEYKFNDYIAGLSPLFLNWEFRAGGAIFRQVDVALLGTYAWYPGLNALGIKKGGFHNISGQEGFIGLEFSSRVSAFNINIKVGEEIFKGNYNFLYNTGFDQYQYRQIPFNLNNFGIKVGFTLGQEPAKGNNMARLWHKAIVSDY